MKMQWQCNNNRKYSPLKGKLEQELFLKEQLSYQTAGLLQHKRIAEVSYKQREKKHKQRENITGKKGNTMAMN